MKRREGINRLKKMRFTAGISRFFIDAIALGSRILIGEDPLSKK